MFARAKILNRQEPSFDVTAAPDIKRLNGRVLFIGLGAMKAGTTWISDYLRGHPQVFHSEIKEINFWNKLDHNPLIKYGTKFRMYRMKEILLKKNASYPPTLRQWETLQTLAEIDNLETTIDYQEYFARRIGNETHFGEVCPQYSLMPSRTYQRIAALGYETRFLFFMRDPTDRVASNLQHHLRRNRLDVDQLIENLTEDDIRYQRSDYSLTLEAYRKSGVNIPLKTFIYEDMFNENSLREICDFLGIWQGPAKFDKRSNASSGVKITAAQKQRIREKLDPLYVKLADFLDEKPPSWRW